MYLLIIMVLLSLCYVLNNIVFVKGYNVDKTENIHLSSNNLVLTLNLFCLGSHVGYRMFFILKQSIRK